MLPSVVLQSTTLEAVWSRFLILMGQAAQGVLDLLFAVIVALVGWLLARLLSRLTLFLLRALRFNEGVRRIGGTPGGPERFEPAALASWGVYWVVLLMTTLLACDVLGLDLTAAVSERLHEALPRVAAATIELVIGILIAMALGAVTRRVFETAGVGGSRMRGQIVTAVLSAFAVLLALEQLGLAAQFIMAVGVTVLASLGLAVALAFGLGCRELAHDFIVEYLRSHEDQAPRRPL